MTPAEKIVLWAEELRDMSAVGLHFATTIYDHDRYKRLQSLAMEMQAFAGGELAASLEPLRATLFSHPTPMSCGDAAIIDSDGRILLIQRADNQMWAMPGGGFEVGETPAEGAVREAREEAGIICEAVALIGVFDSRLCGAQSRHHLYQFLFLCKPIEQLSTPPSHQHEVLNIAWYTEDQLPHPIDPGHIGKIQIAYAAWHGEQRTFFDA